MQHELKTPLLSRAVGSHSMYVQYCMYTWKRYNYADLKINYFLELLLGAIRQQCELLDARSVFGALLNAAVEGMPNQMRLSESTDE